MPWLNPSKWLWSTNPTLTSSEIENGITPLMLQSVQSYSEACRYVLCIGRNPQYFTLWSELLKMTSRILQKNPQEATLFFGLHGGIEVVIDLLRHWNDEMNRESEIRLALHCLVSFILYTPTSTSTSTSSEFLLSRSEWSGSYDSHIEECMILQNVSYMMNSMELFSRVLTNWIHDGEIISLVICLWRICGRFQEGREGLLSVEIGKQLAMVLRTHRTNDILSSSVCGLISSLFLPPMSRTLRPNDRVYNILSESATRHLQTTLLISSVGRVLRLSNSRSTNSSQNLGLAGALVDVLRRLLTCVSTSSTSASAASDFDIISREDDKREWLAVCAVRCWTVIGLLCRRYEAGQDIFLRCGACEVIPRLWSALEIAYPVLSCTSGSASITRVDQSSIVSKSGSGWALMAAYCNVLRHLSGGGELQQTALNDIGAVGHLVSIFRLAVPSTTIVQSRTSGGQPNSPADIQVKSDSNIFSRITTQSDTCSKQCNSGGFTRLPLLLHTRQEVAGVAVTFALRQICRRHGPNAAILRARGIFTAAVIAFRCALRAETVPLSVDTQTSEGTSFNGSIFGSISTTVQQQVQTIETEPHDGKSTSWRAEIAAAIAALLATLAVEDPLRDAGAYFSALQIGLSAFRSLPSPPPLKLSWMDISEKTQENIVEGESHDNDNRSKTTLSSSGSMTVSGRAEYVPWLCRLAAAISSVDGVCEAVLPVSSLLLRHGVSLIHSAPEDAAEIFSSLGRLAAKSDDMRRHLLASTSLASWAVILDMTNVKYDRVGGSEVATAVMLLLAELLRPAAMALWTPTRLSVGTGASWEAESVVGDECSAEGEYYAEDVGWGSEDEMDWPNEDIGDEVSHRSIITSRSLSLPNPSVLRIFDAASVFATEIASVRNLSEARILRRFIMRGFRPTVALPLSVFVSCYCQQTSKVVGDRVDSGISTSWQDLTASTKHSQRVLAASIVFAGLVASSLLFAEADPSADMEFNGDPDRSITTLLSHINPNASLATNTQQDVAHHMTSKTSNASRRSVWKRHQIACGGILDALGGRSEGINAILTLLQSSSTVGDFEANQDSIYSTDGPKRSEHWNLLSILTFLAVSDNCRRFLRLDSCRSAVWTAGRRIFEGMESRSDVIHSAEQLTATLLLSRLAIILSGKEGLSGVSWTSSVISPINNVKPGLSSAVLNTTLRIMGGVSAPLTVCWGAATIFSILMGLSLRDWYVATCENHIADLHGDIWNVIIQGGTPEGVEFHNWKLTSGNSAKMNQKSDSWLSWLGFYSSLGSPSRSGGRHDRDHFGLECGWYALDAEMIYRIRKPELASWIHCDVIKEALLALLCRSTSAALTASENIPPNWIQHTEKITQWELGWAAEAATAAVSVLYGLTINTCCDSSTAWQIVATLSDALAVWIRIADIGIANNPAFVPIAALFGLLGGFVTPGDPGVERNRQPATQTSVAVITALTRGNLLHLAVRLLKNNRLHGMEPCEIAILRLLAHTMYFSPLETLIALTNVLKDLSTGNLDNAKSEVDNNEHTHNLMVIEGGDALISLLVLMLTRHSKSSIVWAYVCRTLGSLLNFLSTSGNTPTSKILQTSRSILKGCLIASLTEPTSHSVAAHSCSALAELVRLEVKIRLIDLNTTEPSLSSENKHEFLSLEYLTDAAHECLHYYKENLDVQRSSAHLLTEILTANNSLVVSTFHGRNGNRANRITDVANIVNGLLSAITREVATAAKESGLHSNANTAEVYRSFEEGTSGSGHMYWSGRPRVTESTSYTETSTNSDNSTGVTTLCGGTTGPLLARLTDAVVGSKVEEAKQMEEVLRSESREWINYRQSLIRRETIATLSTALAIWVQGDMNNGGLTCKDWQTSVIDQAIQTLTTFPRFVDLVAVAASLITAALAPIATYPSNDSTVNTSSSVLDSRCTTISYNFQVLDLTRAVRLLSAIREGVDGLSTAGAQAAPAVAAIATLITRILRDVQIISQATPGNPPSLATCDLAARLASTGACEWLPAMLATHANDAVASIAGCAALTALATVDDQINGNTSGHMNRSETHELDGVIGLSCIENHHLSRRGESYAARLGGGGACEVLSSILNRHIDSPLVVQAVAQAVPSLASAPGNAAWLTALGFCEILRDCMDKHGGIPETSVALLRAISAILATNGDEVRKRMIPIDGTTTVKSLAGLIVSILQSHADYEPIILAATTAIWRLAEPTSQRILSANDSDIIANLSPAEVEAGGLQRALGAPQRAALQYHGAARLLAGLASTHADDATLTAAICRASVILTIPPSAAAEREAFTSGGFAVTVTRILRIHGPLAGSLRDGRESTEKLVEIQDAVTAVRWAAHAIRSLARQPSFALSNQTSSELTEQIVSCLWRSHTTASLKPLPTLRIGNTHSETATDNEILSDALVEALGTVSVSNLAAQNTASQTGGVIVLVSALAAALPPALRPSILTTGTPPSTTSVDSPTPTNETQTGFLAIFGGRESIFGGFANNFSQPPLPTPSRPTNPSTRCSPVSSQVMERNVRLLRAILCVIDGHRRNTRTTVGAGIVPILASLLSLTNIQQYLPSTAASFAASFVNISSGSKDTSNVTSVFLLPLIFATAATLTRDGEARDQIWRHPTGFLVSALTFLQHSLESMNSTNGIVSNFEPIGLIGALTFIRNLISSSYNDPLFVLEDSTIIEQISSTLAIFLKKATQFDEVSRVISFAGKCQCPRRSQGELSTSMLAENGESPVTTDYSDYSVEIDDNLEKKSSTQSVLQQAANEVSNISGLDVGPRTILGELEGTSPFREAIRCAFHLAICSPQLRELFASDNTFIASLTSLSKKSQTEEDIAWIRMTLETLNDAHLC